MKNKVTDFFEKNGYGLEVFFTGKDTATVAKAAEVLGVEPGMIAKTLALKLPNRNIVLVAMGTARIDNKKFRQRFGAKAVMMNLDETQAATGYAAGAVCPFALPDDVEVYLDESLKVYDIVYPACGTADSAVKIIVDNFAKYTGGSWVDVCTNGQKQEGQHEN